MRTKQFKRARTKMTQKKELEKEENRQNEYIIARENLSCFSECGRATLGEKEIDWNLLEVAELLRWGRSTWITTTKWRRREKRKEKREKVGKHKDGRIKRM
ncbi:MAG: hypothetical protein Q8P67_06960 [archaeon]|nr:hypothetical protein [archaeon]